MAKGMYPRVLATSVAMVTGMFGLAHAVGPRSLDILSREQGVLVADQAAFLLDVSTERPSDVTGSLPERYEYDPYGTCRIYAGWDNAAANEGLYVMGQSRIGNAIRYAGYFWDDETELYHVRHRKYDPQTQRWLQRDPLEYADDTSLYAYVRDNPNAYIDPMGKCIPLGAVQKQLRFLGSGSR